MIFHRLPLSLSFSLFPAVTFLLYLFYSSLRRLCFFLPFFYLPPRLERICVLIVSGLKPICATASPPAFVCSMFRDVTHQRGYVRPHGRKSLYRLPEHSPRSTCVCKCPPIPLASPHPVFREFLGKKKVSKGEREVSCIISRSLNLN